MRFLYADSPKPRMLTRRMIADKEAMRAREILEASLPKLIVDRKRLEVRIWL